MTTYERQKLSKIANQWFSSSSTKRLSLLTQRNLQNPVFTNIVLLLLEMKLLVYGEKRQQKPKLICLQYATLYSTTLVFLFEIFQISLIWYMVPNKIIMEIKNSYWRYKSLTYRLISSERSNRTIFMEKAKVDTYWSRLPQFGSSHQFESYRQKLPVTVAKTELN